MKVLIVSGSFPPMVCGVGDYTYNLAVNLGKINNVDIAIVTDVKAGENSQEGVEIFPVVDTWDIFSLRKILSIVKSWEPDLVHIQYPTLGYKNSIFPSFLPLLFSPVAPVVETWHEPLSRKGLFRYFPNCLAKTRLITVEENYHKFLPRWYAALIKRKKNVHIPIASNIPYANLGKEAITGLRRKYNCGERKLISFFGMINERKGVESLLEIVDFERDKLIIISSIDLSTEYHQKFLKTIEHSRNERAYCNTLDLYLKKR